MANWIDTHCHLGHESFSHDLGEVLQRAKQQGVGQFITSAVNYHQWIEQLCLQAEHPEILNSFGIHPWFCEQHREKHLQQLESLLPQAVAIGECGLDFMAGKADRATQLKWFQAQLKLAVKHDKPLIIHSVKASDTIAAELKKHPVLRGVIHGFSGSMQQAEAFIRLGFHIGIGTRMVRADGPKVEAMMNTLPLDSILLETDSPDGLGKQARNEPAGLIVVAKVIAKLRNQDHEVILETCSKNARELFKL